MTAIPSAERSLRRSGLWMGIALVLMTDTPDLLGARSQPELLSKIEGLVSKAGLKIIRSFPESSYRFPVKYFSRNICISVKNYRSA